MSATRYDGDLTPSRMRHARRWLACSLVVVLAALGVPPLLAQQPIEAGIARDAKSGTPLECLHVALLDSAGSAVVHAVTDSAGQFMLDAPRTGVYRVQFTVRGWEPLVGPVDTLREGDFRQRAYPLAFDRRLLAGSLDKSQRGKGSLYRREQIKKLNAYLRATDSDSGWRSAIGVPIDIGIRYPDGLRFARKPGDVLARFIVDSTGKPRQASWRTIVASHPDFERAVRSSLSRSRWTPAQIKGRPVCELVYDYTRFSFEGAVVEIDLETR